MTAQAELIAVIHRRRRNYKIIWLVSALLMAAAIAGFVLFIRATPAQYTHDQEGERWGLGFGVTFVVLGLIFLWPTFYGFGTRNRLNAHVGTRAIQSVFGPHAEFDVSAYRSATEARRVVALEALGGEDGKLHLLPDPPRPMERVVGGTWDSVHTLERVIAHVGGRTFCADRIEFVDRPGHTQRHRIRTHTIATGVLVSIFDNPHPQWSLSKWDPEPSVSVFIRDAELLELPILGRLKNYDIEAAYANASESATRFREALTDLLSQVEVQDRFVEETERRLSAQAPAGYMWLRWTEKYGRPRDRWTAWHLVVMSEDPVLDQPKQPICHNDHAWGAKDAQYSHSTPEGDWCPQCVRTVGRELGGEGLMVGGSRS